MSEKPTRSYVEIFWSMYRYAMHQPWRPGTRTAEEHEERAVEYAVAAVVDATIGFRPVYNGGAPTTYEPSPLERSLAEIRTRLDALQEQVGKLDRRPTRKAHT